jgi:peptidoglycan/LPS O-acetylase OafA/YrhL
MRFQTSTSFYRGSVRDTHMKTNSHAYPSLDALRGIAAISVMIIHCNLRAGGMTLLPGATMAVDFFFVLSGFVIGHAYEARLLAGQRVLDFMTLRLIRLYPLYFLGMTLPLLTILWQVLMNDAPFRRSLVAISYFLGILFLPTPTIVSPVSFRLFPLNSPAWSLSLEILINLAYAIFCLKLSTRRLGWICAAGCVGLTVACFYFGTLDIGWNWHQYLGGIARVVWSFSMGILLHRLYRPYRLSPRWLVLLIAIMIGLFAYRDQIAWLQLVSVIVVFPAIVWVGASIQLGGFAEKAATWLGAISYALYITHVPILELIVYTYKVLGIDPKSLPHHLPTIVLWSVITIGAAWVLDLIYDAPVRAAIARRLQVRVGIQPRPS